MADLAVDILKLIYMGFRKIKEVAKTLDQNNEDLRNIEQLVDSWAQILSPFEKNPAILKDEGITSAVKCLWKTLESAEILKDDADSSSVSVFLNAGDKADKLHRLKQDISLQIGAVNGAMTAYIVVMLTEIYSQNRSQSQLPPMSAATVEDEGNLASLGLGGGLGDQDTTTTMKSRPLSARAEDQGRGHGFGSPRVGCAPHILVPQDAVRTCADDTGMMKTKIHRYPRSIQDLGEWYTIPRIVAIGPYHHSRELLMHAEMVKHVAAYHCIKISGCSVQDIYNGVISVVAQTDACRHYDEGVMEGVREEEFIPMMFFDACFLVMYMLKLSGTDCDTMLYDFLEVNDNDIAHDIMLLENQIPWPVVTAIMEYTSVPLEEFIARWKDRCLQDRVDRKAPTVVSDDSYEPPHLLGLLRFHTVGRSRRITEVHGEKMKSVAVSVSAIELAEMGINLTSNKTTELADMALANKPICAELSMAPLALNNLRACLLVNMAALELCTTPGFLDDEAEDEDSAVCSYLRLLCMLMHREEDVHQLRTNGILQGGAGLTNKEALDLFTGLQSLRLGRCCARVMLQIESYRLKRPMRIKVYTFLKKNCKGIKCLKGAQ